jgi:3-phenylpropionate/trans-cinnamate dioxygenase ferredoxin subunit
VTEVTYVRVCPASEVKPGTVMAREVEGTPVALIGCADGTIHAIHDVCSHEEYPLSDGEVIDCTIECTWHGSEFDVRTGEPINLPAVEPVAVYPVDIRDGDIFICLSPSNGVVAA